MSDQESKVKLESFERLAEIGFRAYNEAAGGKTHDGKDIPPFDEMKKGGKPQVGYWCAAAAAIAEEVFPKEDGIIHVVTADDTALLETGCVVGDAIFVPNSAVMPEED